MSEHVLFVRIDGEPFRSRAKQYREDLADYRSAWWALAKSKGASGLKYGVRGFIFPDGKVPSGWNKPKGRDGMSAPRKGHPDCDLFAQLPSKPKSSDIFDDSLIYDLNYEGPNRFGCGEIGWFQFVIDGPSIGWTQDDIFIAVIPDAKAAADAHLAAHPEDRITSGADKWSVPSGLTVISQAEKDLIFAESAVKCEREKSCVAPSRPLVAGEAQ